MRILKNEYDKWISIIEVKIYAEKVENMRLIHGNFDFKCNEFCYYKI